MKKVGLLFVTFFGCMGLVNAASITVTSSSDYATSGGRITFYVNIRDAGAWQLTGSGTGATSSCSLGEQGVGDTGTGRNGNKTLVVTCNATSVGQISFYVSGNVTDASSGKSTDVSGRKIVTVQAPREKDSNNYLKSLGVTDYTLSPEFSRDTLEYSITVPSTVDKVTIEAIPESSYATVTGTGEFEVDDGVNTKEISVMSETGVERIYKVVVQVKDENPIQVKMNGKDYTILKNIKNVVKPELYDATTMKIQDFDIPIFVSDITGYTLVALKDESGNTVLAVYDKENNSYVLYHELKSSSLLLNILEPEEEWEEYEKISFLLDDISYQGYRFTEDGDYIIVYAMNIETGEKNYYLYHEKSNIFQLFTDEVIQRLREENLNRQYIIYGLSCAVAFFFLLSMFAIFKKPSRRKWKRIDECILDDSTNFVEDTEVFQSEDTEVAMNEESNESIAEESPEVFASETETLIDSFIEEKPKTKKEKKKWKKMWKKKEEEFEENLDSDQEMDGEKEFEVKEEEVPSVEDSVSVTQILPQTKEEMEDVLSETVDVKVALSKMNDAEEIIREYEKTLSLSKEELRKAREAQKQEEEKTVKESASEETLTEVQVESSTGNHAKKKKRKKRKK